MKISSMSKYALGTLAAAGILAGCGSGAQSGLGQTGTMPSVFAGQDLKSIAEHPLPLQIRVPAPMGFVRPDKKKKAKGQYAYIASYYADEIQVYEYKNGKFGKEVGTASGTDPEGVCATTTDAWVANTGASELIEFKAGSSKSTGTLSDSGYYPSDCAIDKAGDIALSNILSTSDGDGNVVVFKGGKGRGTAITCPNLAKYYELGYDSKGDLFVDGETAVTGGSFGFCEIAAGKKTGAAITLSANPEFPGGVLAYGSYVTILDQEAATIDEYSIKGSKGTEKGTISLSESGDDLIGDWIDGSYLLAANFTAAEGDSFKLPKGGAAISTASGGDGTDGIGVTGK